MKVLSVGEMVIDFLPGEEPGSYIRKAGGAPANVAVALARMGIDVSFCGMMGNDDFGRFLLKTLEDNGVEPCIKDLTDEAITTMAFVSLDETGNRSFTFARKPGADMFLSCEHIKEEYINAADIIHSGSCTLSKGPAAEATMYALSLAKRKGKLVSFDVNYRDLIWDGDKAAAAQAIRKALPYVDLLKLSDEEVDILGGEEALWDLAERNDISIVVETLGERGARCLWRESKTKLSVGALRADCVDSCGAGDAFWGAFLSKILRAGVKSPKDLKTLHFATLEEALRCGNTAGWLCVQKKGALESLPTYAELMHHVKEFWGPR